jgi:diguanylate cyclase (GGDEF)-like protein
MCDVDGLKAINTRHGRSSGDEALLWLAGLVEDRLGDRSPVARLTGDKFAFLLTEPDVEAAIALVDEMCERLGRETFVADDGEEFRISANFVVAPIPPGVDNATRWLDLADLRLADGQREGRPVVMLRPESVSSSLLETRKMQRAHLRPRPSKKR